MSGTSCGGFGANSAAGSENFIGRLGLHQNQNEFGFFHYVTLICSSNQGALEFPAVIDVGICHLQVGILDQQLLCETYQERFAVLGFNAL